MVIKRGGGISEPGTEEISKAHALVKSVLVKLSVGCFLPWAKPTTSRKAENRFARGEGVVAVQSHAPIVV